MGISQPLASSKYLEGERSALTTDGEFDYVNRLERRPVRFFRHWRFF